MLYYLIDSRGYIARLAVSSFYMLCGDRAAMACQRECYDIRNLDHYTSQSIKTLPTRRIPYITYVLAVSHGEVVS